MEKTTSKEPFFSDCCTCRFFGFCVDGLKQIPNFSRKCEHYTMRRLDLS